MREEETPKTAPVKSGSRESSHPWVDLPVQDDDSIGEAVRYSLDEIRYASSGVRVFIVGVLDPAHGADRGKNADQDGNHRHHEYYADRDDRSGIHKRLLLFRMLTGL